MAWRSKSKLRANAIKHGYRSGFEHKVSDQLKENKIKFKSTKDLVKVFEFANSL